MPRDWRKDTRAKYVTVHANSKCIDADNRCSVDFLFTDKAFAGLKKDFDVPIEDVEHSFNDGKENTSEQKESIQ